MAAPVFQLGHEDAGLAEINILEICRRGVRMLSGYTIARAAGFADFYILQEFMMQKIQAKTIDEYIAVFPKDVQGLLQQVRQTISKNAPEAEESISYAIPTFKHNGNLVHFAAFKNHIGFYPGPQAIKKFERELAPYAQGRGSIQFPLDQPLPLKLISDIVRFRIDENRRKAQAKKRKPKS